MASNGFVLASAFLTAVEGWYAAEPLLEPLPDRRYVTPGTPARDCEQVTVEVARVMNTAYQPEQEAPDARLVTNLLGGEVRIEVVRCVPTVDDNGNPPSVLDMELAADPILGDIDGMYDAVIDAAKNGDLPGCNGVAFMGWESIAPEGGVGGGATVWRVTF